MDREEIIKFYKQRIEPFVAIFILAFLITACYLVYQDNQLKKKYLKIVGLKKMIMNVFVKKVMLNFIRGNHFQHFPSSEKIFLKNK